MALVLFVRSSGLGTVHFQEMSLYYNDGHVSGPLIYLLLHLYYKERALWHWTVPPSVHSFIPSSNQGFSWGGKRRVTQPKQRQRKYGGDEDDEQQRRKQEEAVQPGAEQRPEGAEGQALHHQEVRGHAPLLARLSTRSCRLWYSAYPYRPRGLIGWEQKPWNTSCRGEAIESRLSGWTSINLK
ncbi:hypothetical protein SAY87_016992 [Trapa incisa]|uniref:Uncharacterized protein n=1 Tax=Trapa incisa TaxID=236973 RepID=A0AAN7QY05_9MYRT|nr:hypothetical protein SAY87_016992 [Trapa incisa]